ncbi:MAG: N-acetyl-gamma-glutamyl-phosphate reductase [Candidatus Omnitrophica bacterium]|nr:N-acetyl-gamma-glutamyl-phosphate reductase [Candidatus Omnitrophota bacterium]
MNKNKKIKAGVVGATGFTGQMLVRILSSHPSVELVYLSSRTYRPVDYSELHPQFKGIVDIPCEPFHLKKASQKCDVVFLALPHMVSMTVAGKFLNAGKKVIDLAADYRVKDSSLYRKYFGKSHIDKKNLKVAVYGLPEFSRKQIATAALLANPGCYPTSVLLALIPLLKEKKIEPEVIVSSVSSITGAGRKAKLEYHYSNIAGNIWAYKPFSHQHVPEMLECLKLLTRQKVSLTFIPHVAPVDGIYSTISVRCKRKMTVSGFLNIYKKYYVNAPFVRFKDVPAQLKNVTGTNFCEIGVNVSADGAKGVVTSCIDNLIKGAAGSAVQNMNIMFGLDETEGLI